MPMKLEDIRAGLVRVNETLAAQARAEGGPVTFVCECGNCGADFVPIKLEQYDEIRAREDLVLAPGH